MIIWKGDESLIIFKGFLRFDMRREYVKPVMESEEFMANEYVAACLDCTCSTDHGEKSIDSPEMEAFFNNETVQLKEYRGLFTYYDGSDGKLFGVPENDPTLQEISAMRWTNGTLVSYNDISTYSKTTRGPIPGNENTLLRHEVEITNVTS